MRRMMTLVGAAILAVTLAGVAEAKQCKDDKGKFMKCPPADTSTATATHCRDKTTKKFAKCSAPNSEPVPVSATPSDKTGAGATPPATTTTTTTAKPPATTTTAKPTTTTTTTTAPKPN